MVGTLGRSIGWFYGWHLRRVHGEDPYTGSLSYTDFRLKSHTMFFSFELVNVRVWTVIVRISNFTQTREMTEDKKKPIPWFLF